MPGSRLTWYLTHEYVGRDQTCDLQKLQVTPLTVPLFLEGRCRSPRHRAAAARAAAPAARSAAGLHASCRCRYPCSLERPLWLRLGHQARTTAPGGRSCINRITAGQPPLARCPITTAPTWLLGPPALQHVFQRLPGRDRSARRTEVDHVENRFSTGEAEPPRIHCRVRRQRALSHRRGQASSVPPAPHPCWAAARRATGAPAPGGWRCCPSAW
jgi:hypothetical protein